MEPHHVHGGILWDGWVLMLPGIFVAAVLVTALALNGPGEALYTWVRAQLAPNPWRARWDDAVTRHQATAQAFAEFECDLDAVLRLPALADVEQPATARFVDAFAEANALRTDEFPGPDYARRFVEAVEHAEQGWAAAVEAAERKRDARFDPAERRLIAQVRTLLGVAASSDFESERRRRVPAGPAPARRAGAAQRVAGAAAGGHGPGAPGARHAGRGRGRRLTDRHATWRGTRHPVGPHAFTSGGDEFARPVEERSTEDSCATTSRRCRVPERRRSPTCSPPSRSC